MSTEPLPTLSSFELLTAYNPWWGDLAIAFTELPTFRRDVFDDLYADVTSLPQMVSVTGPRRVGKSTLLQQCIQQLIADAPDGAAQARRIVYFSMQDPGLELPGFDADRFFNQLVASAAAQAKEGTVYLFLDEIQRFPRWELYLKKYYDLKTPVRFIVSGSASTPIFRKSRESLLGRIKDFHVLPFSFREYWASNPNLGLSARRRKMLPGFGELGREWSSVVDQKTLVTHLSEELPKFQGIWNTAASIVEPFLFEGGFPEVWNLPTLLAKQEYLYQNQVERVIFEDLLVAAEFRKPEMLRRFYLGLLKDPGRESNLSQVSKELGMVRSTIESYFPLLEATDLVWRLHKHTSTKATPKAGNFKTYLVDLAVRNAVMKLSQEQMVADATLMGAYAENVVANHLRRWPGLVELGYWRRNNDEIDFIVDLGSTRIAVEVKYRNQVLDKDVLKAARLAQEHGCEACVVVSKEPLPDEALERLKAAAPLPVAVVPLAAFLMLF
ncbi:putative AAA+ superfamily ATPase [Hydrogenophaga palleronii]|uniref:AAA+ superfamily ATPase n=1 Tax=Hydrogenophaga palleronii TaxID=65655 RepID=A0ABU1WKR6_9BURK|nr:ATP-binding protein [Hydrogenophaga palleronii]MDR7149596.1 putative AAA+ superfamily ATPase [Hydrogenophaga palleronii]